MWVTEWVGARRREGHRTSFVFVKAAPGGSVPFQTAYENPTFSKVGSSTEKQVSAERRR
jgi:hypothetical protein